MTAKGFFKCIFCITTMLLAQGFGATNLITNPDFESGTSGWTGVGCDFSSSTSEHRSGSKSGYADNRTNTWSSIRQSMLGKMEAGKTYRISGWMKLEGASSDNINIAFVKTDDSGTHYPWIDSGTGYDDQWTELKDYYTLDVNGTLTQLDLYFEGPAVGVSYYLDDVNIIEMGDWKEDADARIEQYRKRDAKITIVNKLGLPIEGVEVDINQVKHRFAFGSAISTYQMSNTDYLNFFKDHFEWAVCENASKWYHTEYTQGNVNYTDADEIYNWCSTNGITMRGHCLYWSVQSAVQDWIQALSYAPLPAMSELRTAVESRMNSAMNHFKGKFVHWDINNEMLHGSFFKDRLDGGPSYKIRPWMFQAANAIDPNCKLFVNDYSIISGSLTEEYKEQIQDLLDDGAPIHGIGVQGHFSNTVEPHAIYEKLESLAEMNLPIWCTEFDFSSEDVNIRADGLEKLYRVAFSHPSVEGILMWGFWEDSLWRDYCHIVDSDWTLNEAGIRYEELLDEWTTHDYNDTNEAGNVNFRGFHGTYDITLTVPGIGSEVQAIELEPGETAEEFVLELDIEPSDCDEVFQLGYGLASDISGDCYVDYYDLEIIANHWLEDDCGTVDCEGSDFEPDGNVDFVDFALFGPEWQQCNKPGETGCIENW